MLTTEVRINGGDQSINYYSASHSQIPTTLPNPNNTIKSTKMASQARSLYRRLLRELPARSLANPSPLQSHIRADFSSHTPLPSTPQSLSHQLSTKPPSLRLQEAEQYIQYLKQQRVYATLIERYNPGMNMSEEDRVQKTARRVGMDLPDEWVPGAGEGGKA